MPCTPLAHIKVPVVPDSCLGSLWVDRVMVDVVVDVVVDSLEVGVVVHDSVGF